MRLVTIMLMALFLCSVAKAQTLDLKTTCHAIGDGVADDAQAMKTCLQMLNQSDAAGHPQSLHIPAGIYRISGAYGAMPVLSRGGVITGDGPHATTLRLDPDFAGDLFAWDEAWTAASYGKDRVDLASDATGPSLSELRITGSRSAAHRQNAIVFYDRNDHVLLRDLEVDYLNGDCLSIGRTRRMPEAYMRESAFYNLKCFSSGSAEGAAVTIASTTRPESDATNELDIYKLAVFDAAGEGVAIRNPQTGSATRGIRFFGLRIEKTKGVGLSIGDPADLGQVAGITVFDLTVIHVSAAALWIGGNPKGPQPYDIRISGGSLGPLDATSIDIDNGRLIDIALDDVDAPIILGPHAGKDISISGNGAQSSWRFIGTVKPGAQTDALELRSPYSLRGLPGAGDRVGEAALKANLLGGATARLTMDGGPADAYNCFNAASGQSYSLGLRVLLQDNDHPTRFFSWTMPLLNFSAWYGARSARVTTGPAAILQNDAAGSDIEVSPDPTNGCISLVARAAPPAGDHWSATALISYARAP